MEIEELYVVEFGGGLRTYFTCSDESKLGMIARLALERKVEGRFDRERDRALGTPISEISHLGSVYRPEG